MNKTKIEWADYTWNPVTGCQHGCPYCYANKIVRRFSGEAACSSADYYGSGDPHVLDDPAIGDDGTKTPWPWVFEPTFHRYKLQEPARKTKPVTIFVSSMGDLFGEWVPGEWIEEVFQAIEHTNHRYIFLTKNPEKYRECDLPEGEFYYGASATNEEEIKDVIHHMALLKMYQPNVKTFISIEPLLSDIIEFNPLHYCLKSIDWVIIGGLSGKDKYQQHLLSCHFLVHGFQEKGLPVFVKDNIGMKEPPRGLPWEVNQ